MPERGAGTAGTAAPRSGAGSSGRQWTASQTTWGHGHASERSRSAGRCSAPVQRNGCAMTASARASACRAQKNSGPFPGRSKNVRSWWRWVPRFWGPTRRQQRPNHPYEDATSTESNLRLFNGSPPFRGNQQREDPTSPGRRPAPVHRSRARRPCDGKRCTYSGVSAPAMSTLSCVCRAPASSKTCIRCRLARRDSRRARRSVLAYADVRWRFSRASTQPSCHDGQRTAPRGTDAPRAAVSAVAPRGARSPAPSTHAARIARAAFRTAATGRAGRARAPWPAPASGAR